MVVSDNKQIVNLLKEYAKENHITLSTIAKNLNMRSQILQKMLNKENFSFNDAKKICDAMNCQLVIDILPASPNSHLS